MRYYGVVSVIVCDVECMDKQAWHIEPLDYVLNKLLAFFFLSLLLLFLALLQFYLLVTTGIRKREGSQYL